MKMNFKCQNIRYDNDINSDAIDMKLFIKFDFKIFQSLSLQMLFNNILINFLI
jgi:hypothetical protein